MSVDLLVTNATLPDGRRGQDIAVASGRITGIAPSIATEAIDTTCLAALCRPAFPHGRSLGLPRLNESGTLLEGIALWGEL